MWTVQKIEKSSEELFSLLEKKEWYLSDLQQLNTEKRKQEWLLARILIKQLCGEEKKILYTSSGKPYLEDKSFQISISHTKNYVAVIADKENSVGIDIEYISERVKKIRSRFMSLSEENNLCKELEIEHLLLHWSAKETLFKIIDEEDIDFREHLHIRPFIPQKNIFSSFDAFESRTPPGNSYKINYLITDNYVLTFV